MKKNRIVRDQVRPFGNITKIFPVMILVLIFDISSYIFSFVPAVKKVVVHNYVRQMKQTLFERNQSNTYHVTSNF